jgi:hypothetical protein
MIKKETKRKEPSGNHRRFAHHEITEKGEKILETQKKKGLSSFQVSVVTIQLPRI